MREKSNVLLVFYRPPLCTFVRVSRSSLFSFDKRITLQYFLMQQANTWFLFLFAATGACLCQKPGNVCVTTCQKQASLTGTCTERFLHRCNKTNERDHQKLSSLVGRQQNEDKAWFFPYIFLTLCTKAQKTVITMSFILILFELSVECLLQNMLLAVFGCTERVLKREFSKKIYFTHLIRFIFVFENASVSCWIQRIWK